MTCPFCTIEEKVLDNELAFAIYDKYPVSNGHLLGQKGQGFCTFCLIIGTRSLSP
jgi:hypothetical protein